MFLLKVIPQLFPLLQKFDLILFAVSWTIPPPSWTLPWSAWSGMDQSALRGPGQVNFLIKSRLSLSLIVFDAITRLGILILICHSKISPRNRNVWLGRTESPLGGLPPPPPLFSLPTSLQVFFSPYQHPCRFFFSLPTSLQVLTTT